MVLKFLHEIGSTFQFFVKVIQVGRKTHGHSDAVLGQIYAVTMRSLSTILFAGLFTGGIVALQMGVMLSAYDASAIIGGMTTSATLKEIGPLIIAIFLSGKVGAFTTAELANMRVTEQIDAIECLGTNPIQYLILPRFTAIILSSVALLGAGLLVGTMSAGLISSIQFHINPLQFLSSIPRFTSGWTLFESVFRCMAFSAVVATVSTYKGYTASGGARGVGRAVTESATYTNLFIVFVNYLSSVFLRVLHDLFFGGPVG
jgi:phospholipid/cholesterol/gamma-HCH transport system permease protein